jgi:catechol 2,3-dioxygenase-like lactoylglutathione lyase family enzyme
MNDRGSGTGRCSPRHQNPGAALREAPFRGVTDLYAWSPTQAGEQVPARGIHHIDLAVADVERSLAFYLDLLGPLGWTESDRYATYRGTEEAVYVEGGGQMLGLRPADGGAHRYYDVGIEHLAFRVDRRDEVDDAYTRCLAADANIHFPPEEDRDLGAEGYYALFVFDPDGIRVEVFCWPQAGAPDGT